MPEVYYGNQKIAYAFQQKEGLKNHYITVEKGKGVVLKGKQLPREEADQMILKKARWILDKLELVKSIGIEDIVTGSRLPYLGKKYYTEIYQNPDVDKTRVEFNYSKFKIIVPPNRKEIQTEIHSALDTFYQLKAREKITPRIEKWSEKTGLEYNQLRFQKMEKRWGSCSNKNNILINTEAIKLPYSLIDYLIVHELCHTKEKSHSKAFWAELSRHLNNWKALDERMSGMGL
jgi:hypothetical protein